MRFVLPLVLSLTSSLSAQALDETLAAAEELASTGNYLAARQSLMDAVAGASDRGEVLARLGPIQERLADWAFYAQFPGAGPSDLFHGEVKSFKESGLKIRMVYAWEELTAEQRLDDFFQAEGQWFFRAPLTGDLKFSLEGTWPAEPESIALLVGFDEAGASGWKFSPGFKRTKKSPPLLQPRRLERVGSPFEVFLTATDKLDEPDGDWAYSAELRRSTFSFKRGSRKIGSWETSHPDLTDGYLGFSGVGVKEIDFSGQLDPDLWANRSREMVDQRRKKFVRQEYDFGADMPAWFADMKASSDSRPPFRAPDGVPEAARAAWQELLDPDAKIVLPEWSAEHGGLDAAVLAYAGALRHMLLGEWRACAAQVAEARKAGMDDFGPLHALEWRAQFHLGQRQKATEELLKRLGDWPDDVGYPLARLTGRAYGPRRMLEVLDQVVAAGGLSQRVGDARRAIRAALEQAEATGVRQYAGSLLNLVSEGDADLVQTLGEGGVIALGFVNRYWGQIRQPSEPLLVLHFLDQDARKAFCKRAGLDEDAAGYLPAYRFSLVVEDAEHTDLASPPALFGALWPQMLDSTLDVDHAPRWFVHGFGGILSACAVIGQAVEPRVNLALIERSAENEDGWFFQAHQLVNLPEAEWDKHAYWAVPESYLLLRYLWSKAPRPQQDKFRAYADALFAGETRIEAYQKLLGGADLAALTKELAAYRQGEIDNL